MGVLRTEYGENGGTQYLSPSLLYFASDCWRPCYEMSASCLAFHFANSLRTSLLVSSWQTCQSSKRFRENVMRMTLGTSWGSCSECKLYRTKLNSCWPWPHHGPRGVTPTFHPHISMKNLDLLSLKLKKTMRWGGGGRLFFVTPRNHRGTLGV